MPKERDPANWERMRASERARKSVKRGFYVGSISVGYEQDDRDTAGVWLKGVCKGCGAEATMRASHASDLGRLAARMVRYDCKVNGHDQTGRIEFIGDLPVAVGSMSLSHLVRLEEFCQERVDRAQADLETLQDFREMHFPQGGGEATE